MINIEPCKLDPVPSLRAGVLSPDEVTKRIAPGFINWNPATGRPPGNAPARFGFQRFQVRWAGPRLINETSRQIFKSLDEQGQINPVVLWARWGKLWIAYGGTRAMWAWKNKRELKALVVDYDKLYEHWRLVEYENIKSEYTQAPLGVVPLEFGWKDGEDYVLLDAREWTMLDESQWAEFRIREDSEREAKSKPAGNGQSGRSSIRDGAPAPTLSPRDLLVLPNAGQASGNGHESSGREEAEDMGEPRPGRPGQPDLSMVSLEQALASVRAYARGMGYIQEKDHMGNSVGRGQQISGA